MNIEIPNKFFTTFNDITYYDEPHKYYVNGKELISVTTIIHRYQEDFAEDYWSNYKAEEYAITQKQVLRGWEFINKKGTIKGSAIHDYAESLFLNKVFPYPKQLILNEFGFDPVLPEYDITKKHVNNFYNDVRGKLIPIRTEMVVYDMESLIGGMVDMLFYNVKAKCFQIWDHKTNKQLSMKTERRMKDELYVLDDSDFTIYSLQLSFYKHIIEKHTGIKLGESYIVWYSHNNDSYKIIKIKDMSYYINLIMKKRIEELKAA
jgi:hypothetical protein